MSHDGRKLTKAQWNALANADGLGYGATGSGMVRTAQALRVLGLVYVCPYRRWVTLTAEGRELLHASQASVSAKKNPQRTAEKK